MKRGNAKRWNKKLEKLKRGNKENEKEKDVKYKWGKMKKRGNWKMENLKNEREEWIIVIPEHNSHCLFYSSDSQS